MVGATVSILVELTYLVAPKMAEWMKFIHPVVWPHRLPTINMSQKLGGGCVLSSGGAGSPSNAKLHGLRPTSIPSGILMLSAIWPQ